MLTRSAAGRLAVAAAALAALVLAQIADAKRPTPPPLTGSLSLVDTTWTCAQAVALDSVTVTITKNAVGTNKDGIHLHSGCTGTIGQITVETARGDGVKVSTGAHDLTIGGGTITCDSKLKTVHQDGIQAMSGKNVTFSGVTINCPSGSNAGFFVSWGEQDGTLPPDGILFTHGFIYPTQSSTVNVTDEQTNSGVSFSTLCASRYYTYRKGSAGAGRDIDFLNTYPPFCNPPSG